MPEFTYKQFEGWCEHWGFTVDEGFKAMCFTANIIGQNLSNTQEAKTKADNSPYMSNAFRKIVEQYHAEAINLSDLYGKLDRAIYNMLEKHEGKTKSEE